MPKIGQAGEFVYGWVVVDSAGKIPVPDGVRGDYGFSPGEVPVLLGGGSGWRGIRVCRLDDLRESAMGVILERYPQLVDEKDMAVVVGRSRYYGRAPLLEGEGIALNSRQQEAFEVSPGDRLLVVRVSEVMIAFLLDGPLVEIARGHPELPVWD